MAMPTGFRPGRKAPLRHLHAVIVHLDGRLGPRCAVGGHAMLLRMYGRLFGIHDCRPRESGGPGFQSAIVAVVGSFALQPWLLAFARMTAIVDVTQSERMRTLLVGGALARRLGFRLVAVAV